MDVRLFIDETKFCHDCRLAVFIVLLAWPQMTLYSSIFSQVGDDFTLRRAFFLLLIALFACIIKPYCVVLSNGEFAFGNIIFGYNY